MPNDAWGMPVGPYWCLRHATSQRRQCRTGDDQLFAALASAGWFKAGGPYRDFITCERSTCEGSSGGNPNYGGGDGGPLGTPGPPRTVLPPGRCVCPKGFRQLANLCCPPGRNVRQCVPCNSKPTAPPRGPAPGTCYNDPCAPLKNSGIACQSFGPPVPVPCNSPQCNSGPCTGGGVTPPGGGGGFPTPPAGGGGGSFMPLGGGLGR